MAHNAEKQDIEKTISSSTGYLEREETRLIFCMHNCNGFLFIGGLGSVAISLWVWIEISWLTSRDAIIALIGPLYYVANFTPLAEGGFLVFIVMLGAVGLCSRSRCALVWYFGFLFLLFTVSLVLAIISLTLYFELADTMASSLVSIIRNRYDTVGYDTLTQSIDDIQIEFECCGSSNYTEWETSQWYQNQINLASEGALVPRIPSSCCVRENATTPSTATPLIINETACMYGVGTSGVLLLSNRFMHSVGCHSLIKEEIDVRILTLAGVGISLFVIQFVCLSALINLFKKMGPRSPAQMNFRESDTARQTLDKLEYWLDRESEEIKRQSAKLKEDTRSSVKKL